MQDDAARAAELRPERHEAGAHPEAGTHPKAGASPYADTHPEAGTRPYAGIRVIDLTRLFGAYATRLFADLGAEVIRVEPPGGGSDRRLPPATAGALAAGQGGVPFAFLALNKKSVVVDLTTPEGRDILKALVATATVVVVEPEADDGLLADILSVPGVRVVTVITPFGLTGPYAGFAASDLVVQALGGIVWLSGEPGKPPLKIAGEQSLFVASLYAAAATAIALWDAETRGAGHVVDVSAQECIAHSLQNAVQVFDLEGRVSTRGGEGTRDATESAFACQDGWVFLAAPLALQASWSGLLAWMKEEGFDGHAVLTSAPWQDRPRRTTAAMKAEFKGLIERFLADKTKARCAAEALKRKIVMAPVASIADLGADPQLLFRRFFQTVAMPGIGSEVAIPGAPYRLSEPVWAIDRPAPRLGEHDAEVLGQPDQDYPGRADPAGRASA